MKSYTDIEQSKKLAEILPIESADMWWSWITNPFDEENGGGYVKEPLLHKPVCNPDEAIPCWSLAALLNYLREIDSFPEIEADEFAVTMNISYFYHDVEDEYRLEHMDSINVKEDSFIDACVEMIYKLKEKELL